MYCCDGIGPTKRTDLHVEFGKPTERPALPMSPTLPRCPFFWAALRRLDSVTDANLVFHEAAAGVGGETAADVALPLVGAATVLCDEGPLGLLAPFLRFSSTQLERGNISRHGNAMALAMWASMK